MVCYSQNMSHTKLVGLVVLSEGLLEIAYENIKHDLLFSAHESYQSGHGWIGFVVSWFIGNSL
jgi:hypothetical protein